MPKKGARRTCEICGIKEAHTPEPMFFGNFPLDENRCREWVRLTGNEDLVYLPIEKLNRSKYVCERHFVKKDFTRTGKRLKRRAVPSLNLAASPLSSNQMSDFPLHVFRPTEISNPGAVQGRIAPHTEVVPSTSSRDPGTSASTDPKPGTSATVQGVTVTHTEPVQSSSQQITADSTPDPQKSRGVKRQHPESETSHTEVVPSSSSRDHSGTSASTDPKPGTSATVQGVTVTHTEPVQSSSQQITADSTPDPQKSRGIKRQHPENEELTPRKKKLVERLTKTKCTLNSLKKSAILIEKIQSPVLRELIVNTCKNQKRKPQGRRWSIKHKLSCLAIMKRSRKTYGYLSSAVPMPSARTLQNILKKIPIQTGINPAVLKHLKNISGKKNEKEKLCCLVFDEMAIKSRLLYNESSDIVEGFEDLGEHGRKNNVADHALVFLLQGIYKKFKQPIAFYLTKGTVSSEQLSVIIKNIIKEVAECGFTVISTVCDQGPTNVGALKILREASGPTEDGSNHYFRVNGNKICIIYDVPHLFKSLRNNFLNWGSLTINGATARWQHLVEMEEENKNFLFLSKISSAHVHPKYRAKMKVKLAAQLLSNTTAAVLTLMARAETPQKKAEMEETAKVVRDLDQLFDVTNGPSGPNDKKKGIRTNVSVKTPHMKKWASYIKKIENMKFLDKGIRSNIKCIEGYVVTLKSLRDIWQTVQSAGFKYLNLRNLNQDALENLFGVIRQHSPTNRNPTAAHFVAALKTAVVTGLTAPHSRGANCEADNKQLLTDFHSFVFENEETPDIEEVHYIKGEDENEIFLSPIDEDEENAILLSLPENEMVETDFASISEQPVVYVAGYMAKQIMKKVDCVECKQYLTVNEPEGNPAYSYIMLRKWWQTKFSLTYPSLNLCETIKVLVEKTENELINNLHESNISLLGCTLYDVHCPNVILACKAHTQNVKNLLFDKTSKLLIRRQCQRINQRLALKEEDLANVNKRAEQQGRAK